MKLVKPFGNFGRSESKLSLFELIKQDKDGVFKGNVLIQRLKNNEPLYTSLTRKVEILNPQEVIDNIIDSRGKYSPYKASKFFKRGNRYVPVFQTKDGYIRLNDIYRTRTFGSSGGSSMGTVGTRLNECIQSLFISLRQFKGENLTENDYDNIIQYEDDKTVVNEQLLPNLRIPVLLNEYIMFDFSNWFHTYTQIANELFTNLDSSKTYTIYHAFYNGGLVKTIRDKFQQLVKEESITFKVTMSRWNPSDIYLVDSSMDESITKEILNCSSLDEMNMIMDTHFDSKELISVNIKKVNETDTAELIVTKDESPKFKYTYSTVSEDPFESMTVYVNAVSDFSLTDEKEKLEVRIFSGVRESNVFLEIKGKSGKFGKINIKYLNHILKGLDLETLPEYTDLQSYDYEELINKIDKMYHKLEGKVEYTKPIGGGKTITSHRSKLISKYQSLLLVMLLEENKEVRKYRRQTVSDYILTKMFYYGYSLKNDFFETCKYYRVKTSKN